MSPNKERLQTTGPGPGPGPNVSPAGVTCFEPGIFNPQQNRWQVRLSFSATAANQGNSLAGNAIAPLLAQPVFYGIQSEPFTRFMDCFFLTGGTSVDYRLRDLSAVPGMAVLLLLKLGAMSRETWKIGRFEA